VLSRPERLLSGGVFSGGFEPISDPRARGSGDRLGARSLAEAARALGTISQTWFPYIDFILMKKTV
jgi:hypothetical protein